MLVISQHHTESCFEAWMHCEKLLTNIFQSKKQIPRKVLNVLDECAYICLGTFHAIKSQSAYIRNFAILCVGICEECAELCESHYGEAFNRCARVCRECSLRISSLA